MAWPWPWRGSGPAPPEAVQRAAQGAQALPEPEPGLAGAVGVVGHALASPAVAGVQRSRPAEGQEQQARGQQQEDAGQGDEHGEGVGRPRERPRSDRSREGVLGAGEAGALGAHVSCSRQKGAKPRAGQLHPRLRAGRALPGDAEGGWAWLNWMACGHVTG